MYTTYVSVYDHHALFINEFIAYTNNNYSKHAIIYTYLYVYIDFLSLMENLNCKQPCQNSDG